MLRKKDIITITTIWLIAIAGYGYNVQGNNAQAPQYTTSGATR